VGAAAAPTRPAAAHMAGFAAAGLASAGFISGCFGSASFGSGRGSPAQGFVMTSGIFCSKPCWVCMPTFSASIGGGDGAGRGGPREAGRKGREPWPAPRGRSIIRGH
jgi:hypothetical protein